MFTLISSINIKKIYAVNDEKHVRLPQAEEYSNIYDFDSEAVIHDPIYPPIYPANFNDIVLETSIHKQFMEE